jgi:phage/conjugal plasmid C-4 type zinc finger TraR family protein
MADDIDLAQERSELFLRKALESHQKAAQSTEEVLDCSVCGDEIPERRRRAKPGARTCIDCQRRLERGTR